MNRYEVAAIEIANRIDELHARAKRFAAHATLRTRVPGVMAEIAALEKQLPKMRATGKWARELYAAR